jgi:hypothetical protein
LQVPAALAQDWQSSGLPPPQAVPQQRPSTQRSFEHIAFRVQTPPWGRLAVQVVPLQKKPDGQSPSSAQAPWQAVPAALQGVLAPQGTLVTAGHAPPAVQTAGAIATAFGTVPEHEPARQGAPALGVLHWPPRQVLR